jgi:hypothetical protein
MNTLADICVFLIDNGKEHSQNSVYKDMMDIMSSFIITKSPWVKYIDFDNEINITEFKEFSKIADVEIDHNEKRKSHIKFSSITKDWNLSREVIYIFTFNGKIVKIGGSRNGYKKRCDSYLCGRHTIWRGLSGKCSVTNAVIYDTFEYYLKQGVCIEMYGCFLKNTDNTIQTYQVFESQYIQKYKNITGHNPILSKNSDPKHRL